jgi:pimeloyl-ACP methyl ester carboxylesterase
MKTILIILFIISALLTSAYFILRTERKELDEETRMAADGQFIQLKQGMVHYELAGESDRPLVVLVHGFSTPSYIWYPTFEALVQSGYQVLRFDLYGRGFSDRPDVDYDLNLFIGQTEDLLATLQIDQPVHLMGLSMGGPIAAAYAGRHPEMIRSLTLIDPLVTNIFQSSIFPLNLPGIGEYLMAVVMEPFVLPKSQNGDLLHPERFPDWEDQYKVQTQFKGFGRAILSTMRCIAREDTLAIYRDLAEKKIPTLILRGEEDQTISANDIEILRAYLPFAQFHPISEAGHIPHYEKPSAVNPILINFLGNPGN